MATAKALIDTIEDRNREIRELSKGMTGMENALRLRDEQIAALKEEGQTYRSYWESTLNKLSNLETTIASIDSSAIAEARKDCERQLLNRDAVIAQLREELHRCLGWIDGKNDQHPTRNSRPGGVRPSFMEGEISRPMEATADTHEAFRRRMGLDKK